MDDARQIADSASKLTTVAAKEAVKSAESKMKQLSAGEKRTFNAPEGYRRLTIKLPEKVHKRLRLAAVEDDCTATKIIERLLGQYLAERR